MKKILRSLCGLSLIMYAADFSAAADFSKKIPSGASFGEVVGLWGEPSEKIEKSVKREVVWYYPDDAKVVFRDGRARSFQSTKAVRAVEAQIEAAKAELSLAKGDQLSGETRDLVRDIAKEVPSGPDGPGSGSDSGSGGVSNPSQPPPLIPNQVPPGGRGAPPGVAPGEVIADDAEED